jgi:hypothetical protein
MLLRVGFNQCCEIVGRASAIIALAGMASLVFSATAIDVLRLPSGHLGWAAQSPLWIKSRHGNVKSWCPLLPQKADISWPRCYVR